MHPCLVLRTFGARSKVYYGPESKAAHMSCAILRIRTAFYLRFCALLPLVLRTLRLSSLRSFGTSVPQGQQRSAYQHVSSARLHGLLRSWPIRREPTVATENWRQVKDAKDY